VVELYRSSNEVWFVAAVALALSDLIYQERRDAMAIMTALIEASRLDFEVRTRLDPVVKIWREYARSPVTDSKDEVWASHS
jgi:hypothetical protein